MPNPKRFFLLALIAFCLVAAVIADHVTGTRARAEAATQTVIVELQDDPAAVYKARAENSGSTASTEQIEAYRNQLRTKQDQFLNALNNSGVSYSVVSRAIKNYDGSLAATVPLRYTMVYNGLALEVSPAAVTAIKSMPQVKSVHGDTVLYPSLNSSVPYIKAPQVYGNHADLTQFDTINEGYEGQGMYVSIIDTGVDWTHPMFGGDPTPPRLGVAPPTPAVTNTNQKVVYYLPLTDIAVNDGFGHGTHVASTAAGYLAQTPGPDGLPNTADDIRLHGVAPQAKIMSYKVCSDTFSSIYAASGLALGGCDSSNTIMALEDSVSPFTLTGQPKPVAHAINMSLGGGGGPNEPTAIAASNAALAGAVVVAASGNSGPGEGTTGAPAAGVHVISVAATTHPSAAGASWSADLLQSSSIPVATTGAVTPASSFATAAGNVRLKLFAMSGTAALPSAAIAQRYVFVNDPLVVWPATVSGRIALVKSAIGVTIFDIVAQAANAGAVGVILSDDRGAVNGVRTTIPAATISPADFDVLSDALSSTDDNNADPANGALSELPVRMNPTFVDNFVGEVADFSSRGPVLGLGQVKPDVAAPGVQVLAAVPPASLIGGLAAVASPTSPNYYHLDGTSMASPHVAGAVTLIKQAHLGWSADTIRTVLMNTSTNGRDTAGAAKADGPSADSVLAQGAGLINVYSAVNAKAMMGVVGDGIEEPSILGSHSFGEIPVLDSRVTYRKFTTVTIRDLSGQGGQYNLTVANNRELERSGVGVTLSPTTINVPANGSVTYTVSVSINGNTIRQIPSIPFQWYVVAKSSAQSPAQTLRMPFYMKASRTLPLESRTETESVTGTMIAGDAGQGVMGGVTYVDYPMNISTSVIALEGTLEFLEAADSGVNDLDFYLYGPDDPNFEHPIGVSGVSGGPEHIKVNIEKPGTYTWRVVGFVNAPATQYTLTTVRSLGSPEPVAQTIAGEFTDLQGTPVDFNGNFTLNWLGHAGDTSYEVERSSDGTNFTMIAYRAPNQTSLSVTDQPNGEWSYRVRALTPGVIGSFVTNPSNTVKVIVDRRCKVNITNQVSTAISNVSFTGGVFKLDLNMKNNSTNSYVPFVDLNVVKIGSASGTVRVRNADNGGDGRSTSGAATFAYSNLLGVDQVFSPAEISGSRSLEFTDSAAELFTFDVAVTAYKRTGSGAPPSSPPSGSPNVSDNPDQTPADSGAPYQLLMRISVNPLTRIVSVSLL
jgi:hypothetical protein